MEYVSRKGKRSETVTTLWTEDEITELRQTQEAERYRSLADTQRQLTKLGMWMLKHRAQINDPAQVNQFVAQMNKMIQDGLAAEFVKTQTSQQIQGWQSLYALEKEARQKQ